MTIGGKLASMEKDCRNLVDALNKIAEYRGAMQVQGLLQQVGATRTALEQGDPCVADQEYPPKT